MKAVNKSRVPFRAVCCLFIGCSILLTIPSLRMLAQEEGENDAATICGDSNAGVDKILNADLTKDDADLYADAIDVNGSKASTSEEESNVQTQSDDALFMVNDHVTTKLNVRKEPNKESDTVGALYADCGGTILERKNGWTKVQSGNLVGWAIDEFLSYGDEAKQMAAEVGTTLGTVQVNGLTVRREPNKSASSYGILSQGDVVEIFSHEGDYVGIDYEGGDGYVAAQYVKLTFIIDEGETNEEIEAREKAEREAAEAAKRDSELRRQQMDAERVVVSSTYSDLQLLAAIIYTEAGNQPYEGQVAVGAVVLNRVLSPAYPNSVAGVLYASGQFSPVRSGRFAKCLEKGTYERCLQAAQDALNGSNPIGAACHFHRAGTRTDGITIGDHVFY